MARRCTLLALIVVITAACGSDPIPLQVRAGTTFVLMVPNDYNVGFGRAWTSAPSDPEPLYDPNSTLEDPQRGELFVTGELQGGGPTVEFPIAYMTRLAPAALSPAGLGLLDSGGQPVVPTAAARGQVIAFVEVPSSAHGTYELSFSRKWRSNAGPVGNIFELIPLPPPGYPPLGGVSWESAWGRNGQNQLDHVVLEVLEADPPSEDFNEVEGGDAQMWGQDVNHDSDNLVPLPYVSIEIFKSAAGIEPPAAAEIEFSYPSYLVEIAGASLDRRARDAAILRYSVAGAEATSCSDTGTLKLFLSDPDERTKNLHVAFKLKNFSDQACGRRAQTNDFTLGDFHLFDPNGTEYDPNGYAVPLNPSVEGIY